MFKTLYPSQDTTLYERVPVKNAGVDSILQLCKQTALTAEGAGEIELSEVSGWGNIANSRILLQFDYDDLQTALTKAGNPAIKAQLKLFVARVADLPYISTLEVYPVAQQWTNGTGYYAQSPSKKNGASWYSASNSAVWSFATTGTTGSWASVQGGGCWYTGSQYTSSFEYGYDQMTDIVFDVTALVNAHLSGSLPNYGVIIKWDDAQEKADDTEGYINLFSRESFTVFLPKLTVLWDDAVLTGTGSFTQVPSDGNYNITVKNLKTQYHENEKPTLRLSIRDLYPLTTSYTASAYQDTTKRLPVDSYFYITDSVTDTVVLDYDEFTRVGCDAQGNYIKLDMNSFFPERFYYLNIRSEFDTGEVVYNKNIAFFRVTRI